MSTILFLESSPVCREPIAAILHQKGYTTICAGDGQSGIDLLNTISPDLVLMDFVLPKLSGIAFLKHLRSRPEGQDVPVIVLTAAATREYVLQARQLRAQEYLLKSQFSLEDLLTRIQKHLRDRSPTKRQIEPAPPPGASSERSEPPRDPPAAGKPACVPSGPAAPDTKPRRAAPARNPAMAIPRLLDRDAVRARIASLAEHKIFAGAMAEVIRITDSTRRSTRSLDQMLRQDSGLAERLLHAINEGGLGPNRPQFISIDEAVQSVGIRPVRDLAISVRVSSALSSDAQQGSESLRCWQHCFAVAAILDRFPLKSVTRSDGVAHAMGLCHELGEILLRQRFPQEFETCARVASQSGRPMREVLSIAFDLPYHELISTLLERVGLGGEITSPIAEYARIGHEPNTDLSPLASALRLADIYAHGMLFASSLEAPIYPFARAACRRLFQIDLSPIKAAEIRSEVLNARPLLGDRNGSPAGWDVPPLLGASSARLWYCRQPGLAMFDPILAAIQRVSEPSQHEHLPRSAEEFQNFDGIVLVTPRTGAAPFTIEAIGDLPRALGLEEVPFLCISPEPDETARSLLPGWRHLQSPINLGRLHRALNELAASSPAKARNEPADAAA